jgi:hypothetical protein
VEAKIPLHALPADQADPQDLPQGGWSATTRPTSGCYSVYDFRDDMVLLGQEGEEETEFLPQQHAPVVLPPAQLAQEEARLQALQQQQAQAQQQGQQGGQAPVGAAASGGCRSWWWRRW